MASKPETTFINSVHRYLPTPTSPHREKMNNPYRGGTADVWYSGTKADLWVEYKFIPRIPKKGRIVPALSALQLDWLRKRHEEGRNVAVIVGCKEGGIVFHDESWVVGMPAELFKQRLIDRKDLAHYITRFVME